MVFVDAVAITLAGAPCCTCCTRSDDAANENVTCAPWWADSYALPMAVNASVSDDAANTVTSPEPAPAPPEPPPQAATTRTAIAATACAHRRVTSTAPQRRWSP